MKTLFFIFSSLFGLPVIGQVNCLDSKPFIEYTTSSTIDSISLKYCSCDSLRIVLPSCGKTMLYNNDKQISKCGFFKKYKLDYGLKFIYNTSGKLVEIEEYYNGNKIGSCKP